jgi:prepilin-type N-terminal cleavage/methylation domain-containing protein
MDERGYTLLEMVFVLALILLMASLLIPGLRAYSQEAHLMGAAEKFVGQFREAYSMAVKDNVNTAIRFEVSGRGAFYSLYRDGNGNGVLSADITAGRDPRIAGPFDLTGGAADVRVGINAKVPAIPPDSGTLDPADPIRFGQSNMVSFSPLGTATPGTLYLAGDGAQAAVRVTPGTARVRILFCRGKRWVVR